MADITMCKGSKGLISCPLKDECYRFKAKASERQSMFANLVYNFEEETCEYFWKINGIKDETR